MYIGVCVCVCVYIYIYTRAYVFVYMSIYLYVCNIYVCVCVCVYIYIRKIDNLSYVSVRSGQFIGMAVCGIFFCFSSTFWFEIFLSKQPEHKFYTIFLISQIT